METQEKKSIEPVAPKFTRSVFFCGLLCVGFYILLLFFSKFTNLLHVTGLRLINYVALCVISIVLVRRQIRKYKRPLPFLQVFAVVFGLGVWSFALFALFLYFFSWFDPLLNQLYITQTLGQIRLVPSVVVFFEGTGGSIIVALTVMLYASRFEDGEVSE
jgi:hypothetical protein